MALSPSFFENSLFPLNYLNLISFGMKNVKSFFLCVLANKEVSFLKRKGWKSKRFLIISKLSTQNGVLIINSPSGGGSATMLMPLFS